MKWLTEWLSPKKSTPEQDLSTRGKLDPVAARALDLATEANAKADRALNDLMALEIEARVRWPGWERTLEGGKDEHVDVGTGVAVYIPGGISRVLTAPQQVSEEGESGATIIVRSPNQDAGGNKSSS